MQNAELAARLEAMREEKEENRRKTRDDMARLQKVRRPHAASPVLSHPAASCVTCCE